MRKFILFILVLAALVSNVSAKYSNVEMIRDLAVGSWRVLTGLAEDIYYTTPELTEDAYKSAPEFYQSNGYRFEEHKIVTEDGYILTAWRIPGKITESAKEFRGKPAVMLQHGCLDNSGTFIVGFKNQSLPLILSEEGYDVWITNNRGNFNSYEHINPQEYSVFDMKSKYWNFSFDSMAYYDVPSNVDYILDYTSNEKLTYIGHSQGTMQFFAGNAMKNIAAKIDSFIGLGPVIYVDNIRSPIFALLKNTSLINLLEWLGINNVLLWPTIVNVTLKSIVRPLRKSILRFIQMIVGMKEEISVDLSRMPVMGRHEPGGSSLQNMLHWMQIMNSKEFRRYDYGKEENIKIYGQEAPPLYDFEVLKENVKDLDMLLFRGEIDALVTQEDFERLLDIFDFKIGKTLDYKIVPKYDHLDYVWADNAYEEIGKPIIDFLRERRVSQ
ncbi:unnamed protein product [Moneuplotes crassus]|uniref:Lipase n=1 Tax=Euplotes crassus TaxID=5936 RepID=A0AAD1UP03_EUPCR|nr:unnamed protein product [Moneuplotes crassus]